MSALRVPEGAPGRDPHPAVGEVVAEAIDGRGFPIGGAPAEHERGGMRGRLGDEPGDLRG